MKNKMAYVSLGDTLDTGGVRGIKSSWFRILDSFWDWETHSVGLLYSKQSTSVGEYNSSGKTAEQW